MPKAEISNKIKKTLMDRFKSLNVVATINGREGDNKTKLLLGLNETNEDYQKDLKVLKEMIRVGRLFGTIFGKKIKLLNKKQKRGIAKIPSFKQMKIELPKGIKIDIFTTRTINYQSRQAGCSVSHVPVSNGGNGTLGCFFQGEKKGQLKYYLLSNQHVLDEDMAASQTDRQIYSPSLIEGGGRRSNIIGYLIWNLNTEKIDAAVGKVYNSREETIKGSTVCDYKIKSPIDATEEQLVKLCGSKTRNLAGQIISIDAAFEVQDRHFYNQIMTGNMSTFGDSGAILVDEKKNNAVGLLFAGDNKTVSYYNPINNVLDKFSADKGIVFKKFI